MSATAGDLKALTAQGETRRVRVAVSARADITELWMADVPALLAGDELHDYVSDRLWRGELEPLHDEIDGGESDREILAIEDMPDTPPPADVQDALARIDAVLANADADLADAIRFLHAYIGDDR